MYRKVLDASTAVTQEEIETEYISAVQKINTEILIRDPITFRHVGCEYYGQIKKDFEVVVTDTGMGQRYDGSEAEASDDVLDVAEGRLIPEIFNSEESTDGSSTSSISTTPSQNVTAFVPGTKVSFFNTPVRSTKKPLPVELGRGVITDRSIDNKPYLLGMSANLTKSRKEVLVKHLYDVDSSIPVIANYYAANNSKFATHFDLTQPFPFMIAEAYLAIDVNDDDDDDNNDNNNIDDDDDDDVVGGGRLVGPLEGLDKVVSTPSFLLGTGNDLRRQTRSMGSVQYLDRTDVRLGLNQDEDDEFNIENDDA